MAEVAGLVFGVLPLLVSTIEHYKDVFGPFIRYRKSRSEFGRFLEQLKTRNAIFRNECRLLLEDLVGSQDTENMLGNLGHPLWGSQKLEQQFLDRLGDSQDACKTLLHNIADKLDVLNKVTTELGCLAPQTQGTVESTDRRLPFLSLGRLKFAFSSSSLKLHLQELRDLIQDFSTLISQTNKLQLQRLNARPITSPQQIGQKMQEYRSIQRASRQLLDTLEISCQSHTKHQAHLHINPTMRTPIETGPSASSMTFHLGFASTPEQGLLSDIAAWVAIETTSTFPPITLGEPLRQKTSAQDSMEGLGTNLIRTFGRASEHGHMYSASSTDTITCMQPFPRTPRSANTPWTGSIITEFSTVRPPEVYIRRDLCFQLSKSHCQSGESDYIGTLDSHGIYKYTIHTVPKHVMGNTDNRTSLAQLLWSISDDSAVGEPLLQIETLRLARQIASSVLNFHPTPSILSSICSDKIIFFGDNNDDNCSGRSSLASPCLDIRLDTNMGKRPAAECNASRSRQFIRNTCLFNLGKILIELAYQKPLKRLRKADDLLSGMDDWHTDFLTADRLSKNMASTLGCTYAGLVQKCIHCDFGFGNDLDNPRLQQSFYENIICRLEALESRVAVLL